MQHFMEDMNVWKRIFSSFLLFWTCNKQVQIDATQIHFLAMFSLLLSSSLLKLPINTSNTSS